jgi:hypothetical protein
MQHMAHKIIMVIGPGIVVQAYNPSYLLVRSRRISVQGWPVEKVSKTLSQQQARYSGTHL